MIKFGDFNELEVIREADFGVYLDAKTDSTSDDILLPNGSIVGDRPSIGDIVNAFIYKDSKDRFVATMNEPKIIVDTIALLEVTDEADFGMFLDIGLERDLLVPRGEMNYEMEVGKKYLVFVYEDKTGRLAASTKIDRYLDEPLEGMFEVGQEVTGTVYDVQTNKTLEVAIDNKYKAIILENEYYTNIQPGDSVTGTIKKILEDGRVSFTPRKKMVDAREILSDAIMKELKDSGGSIPYNDKSTPDEIRKKFKTSKNYFKIALGNLMKQDLIYQDVKGTHLKEK
ncbi:MAG: DNA-binding protein [Clostridium sp.]|nr:DNA-binding protein [Clostridium sp.]